MGKKGTKRKTRWRTLSIGEAGSEDESGLKKPNSVDYVNGGTRPSNYSGYQGNNPRNGYGRSSYGHAASGRTFSSQSTPTRRNGSAGGYHPSHQYARNGERSHSSAGPDAPKIKFNEDEYTRITTPRQDVLFKKGYLSKRKTLVASVSTSSAEPGASTSAPSTPSTQSTSPEHHAHSNEIPAESEVMMPDGLMYPNGFYDQNGVFYVNAMPNFDGFGPMMMYPYGPYPPYGHIEYYNQVCMQHPFSTNASYAESQVSDTNEMASPHDDAASHSSPEDSGKASTKDTGDSEAAQHSADSSGVSINNSNGPEQDTTLHNGMVDTPHYIYPGYMFGAQMYHVNGMNIQCGNGMALGGSMDVSNKQKIKKKRRRKQRKPSGCNGTNATDNSEDEFSSDSETANDSLERGSTTSSLMSSINGVQEACLKEQLVEQGNYPPPNSPIPCDPSKSVLNTNCSEFIPKAHLLAKTSQLKTDVQEFVPQCYKVQQIALEQPIETETEQNSQILQVQENIVQKQLVPEVAQAKVVEEKLVEEKSVEEKPVEEKLVEEKLVEEKLVEEKLAQKKIEVESVKVKPIKEKSVKDKAVQGKIEVAVQTKRIKKDSKPAPKQSFTVPLTNGSAHKNMESPIKKVAQPVIETVRKVQIICKEKPSPINCSTPRTDQWTTVKSSRSKNKKNRHDTSSASPTSPVSDVASENTFRMFIEGNVTPPPSEEDGSLDTDKLEDNVCFTSDDTVDNNEEINTEESNTLSDKKNNKTSKTKSKKSKKTKDNNKNKTNSYDNDEKKNKSRTTNGKPHKLTKQVDIESVKSNLAQLLGPTNMTELDFTNVEMRDRMNGIGIEELKELYIELPELKDQHLENLLQSSEDYVYTAPTLSVTDNPKEFIQSHVLPPTPDESVTSCNISKESVNDSMLNSKENDVSSSNSDSEDLQTVASNKILLKEEMEAAPVVCDIKSEEIIEQISNTIDISEDLESTLNSVPDLTIDSENPESEALDSEVVENKFLENELLDEGVIITELKDPEVNYFHITETVQKWLKEQKEKSPEPVLREPDDPALAVLLNQAELDGSGSSDQDTDECDDDSPRNPKNSRGNPLRALSVESLSKKLKAKRSRSTPPSLRRGETGDTDSDYLSDIQDDSRKRVAGITSEPDLLDCWEPDILPFDALPHLVRSKTEDEEVVEQYESVYGKSVDYEKLSASLGAKPPVLPPLRGEGVVPPCNGICCSLM